MENLTINTMADVRCFFYCLMVEYGLGGSFHPDTPFTDYDRQNEDYPDEIHSAFSPEFASFLQERLTECFEVCEHDGIDIYQIGLQMAQRLGFSPRPDAEKIQMVFLFGAESIYEFEGMDPNINIYERLQAVTEDSGYYENRLFDTQAELDAYRLGLNDMNDESHWKGILVG